MGRQMNCNRSPDLIAPAAHKPAAAITRSSAYLHPGHVVTSAEPCEVTTILGSCVSVCMWDPVLRVGGVNHYLLPFRRASGQSSPRFGNVAIARLIEELGALGSAKKRLQAKVFGGAYIFPGFKTIDDHLGANNAEFALQALGEEGIPVISHDIGGPQGRKLRFHTDTGDAWVKLI